MELIRPNDLREKVRIDLMKQGTGMEMGEEIDVVLVRIDFTVVEIVDNDVCMGD